jgi:hydroxymethylbilane synthase
MTRLLCGARDSLLSRAQVEEIAAQLSVFLEPVYFKTWGDRDRETSLRTLGKTDFFTKEIDQALLAGQIRVAVHSAKDIPDPLPQGLVLVALTRGVDPRDCLVLREGEDLSHVRIVATSSAVREERVRTLLPSVQFVDLRGTIQERLGRLDRKEVDGVVVAEAALVRLRLRHLNRFFLPPPSTDGQGQLAVLARKDDREMSDLFRPLDARGEQRTWKLYLGLDPPNDFRLIHYPVLRTTPIPEAVHQISCIWRRSSHVLFTSKRAIFHLPDGLSWDGKRVYVIGEGTAAALPISVKPMIASTANQEGMVELLAKEELNDARLLWPRSSRSRDLLEEVLHRRACSVEIVDLYQTMPHRPGVPPALDQCDALVFTSPSCVDGFFRVYSRVPPPQIALHFQGAVTRGYYDQCVRRALSFCRSTEHRIS